MLDVEKTAGSGAVCIVWHTVQQFAQKHIKKLKLTKLFNFSVLFSFLFPVGRSPVGQKVSRDRTEKTLRAVTCKIGQYFSLVKRVVS